MIYLMETSKILQLLEENNKILKKIEKRLDDLEPKCNKMDQHIDNIMSIYSSYKAPLDYISSSFSFLSYEPDKTLEHSNKNKTSD